MYTGQNIRFTAMHVAGQPQTTFLVNHVTFNNQITPKWSSEAAYGKMDNIPYYSNTTRQVVIDFQTVTNSTAGYNERLLQEAVSNLMKYQYPRYSAAGNAGVKVISSPPFLKIEHFMQDATNTYYEYEPISGYINGNLIISAGSEGGVGGRKLSLQFGSNIPGASNSAAYETGYKVSMTVTVLHETPPGWVGGDWQSDSYFYGATSEQAAPGPVTPTRPLPPGTEVKAAAATGGSGGKISGLGPRKVYPAKKKPGT